MTSNLSLAVRGLNYEFNFYPENVTSEHLNGVSDEVIRLFNVRRIEDFNVCDRFGKVIVHTLYDLENKEYFLFGKFNSPMFIVDKSLTYVFRMNELRINGLSYNRELILRLNTIHVVSDPINAIYMMSNGFATIWTGKGIVLRSDELKILEQLGTIIIMRNDE
jgi:hypothetical protein